MAGLGYKAFASGEVLTAANLQGYAVDQSVMVFASAAARTSALASPSQGMVSFLTDSGTVWQYYAIYNASTNPGGAKAAGWYLAPGSTPFYATATRTTAAGSTYLMGDTGFAMTELRDTLGWHSASTNPTRVTPTVAGFYSFQTNANWAGAATIHRIRTTINGTAFGGIAMPTGLSSSMSTTTVAFLNGSTDYYTADYYNDSGTPVITAQLAVTYLGPASV
jgi:hypothetical protein